MAKQLKSLMKVPGLVPDHAVAHVLDTDHAVEAVHAQDLDLENPVQEVVPNLETDVRDQKVGHLADLEVAQEAALNRQRKIPDLDPVANLLSAITNLDREVVPVPNQEADRNHLQNNW